MPLLEIELNRQYLQTELARVDIFIRQAIRRWQLADQDPTDNFRGLYVSTSEVDHLLTRPLGSNWGQIVPLPLEETEVFAQVKVQSRLATQHLVDIANRQGQTLYLRHLASIFDLDEFSLDALLICLAPTLDLRYERVYGFLQDDITRKRPTLGLILDLLDQSGTSRLEHLAQFTEQTPLLKYRLLELSPSSEGTVPRLAQPLIVDEALVSWLLGNYQPHADLSPHAAFLSLDKLQAERLPPLPYVIDSRLNQIMDMRQRSPLIIFYGPDQISQETAVKNLAIRLRRSLLLVDLAPILKNEDRSPLSTLRASLRDARLTGALPCLMGWDACLNQEMALPPELLNELCAYPDLIVVAGQVGWHAAGIERSRPLLWQEFPLPDYTQRLALWQHFLEMDTLSKKPVAQTSFDIPSLAGQFSLTTGQIRDTIASARDMVAQRNNILQDDDLFMAARSHSNPRLATLAHKIAPRYEWDDIVLPPDQRVILEEIVDTVRSRPRVLGEWGVGQKLVPSAAVTILFAGEPGTGKTMAAEVIAKALDLDLFKIDLSTMISKYIGETEKNLERIFTEAESSNAILFFDEADAIFGKRSEVKDAHDRYANIEVSYLLQRMEVYNGVTILATNLRANLDEAFTRRLQFVLDFPFPEVEDRLHIWKTLFPPDVPRAPDLDFRMLAKRFKLAGGNIRNIIVNAAYRAAADGGQVTMAHLMHGTRRELQKLGRLVGEDDLKF